MYTWVLLEFELDINMVIASICFQVGGWSQVYTNLTFTTVRDSGHQVPLYQPGRALQLFKYFLKGQSLPGFDYKN
jgi:carboxypeptidase C (cathepsin A)